MKSLYVKALVRAVESFQGAVVDESSGRYRVYQCEAPEGEKWEANKCCVIRCEWRIGDDPKPAVEDAIERVNLGTYTDEDQEES